MKPIDSKGTLPACAAGTATIAGPGIPYNQTGSEVALPEPSDEEQQANAESDRVSALRNPSGVNPVDLGFGSPPARPHQVGAKGGAR